MITVRKLANLLKINVTTLIPHLRNAYVLNNYLSIKDLEELSYYFLSKESKKNKFERYSQIVINIIEEIMSSAPTTSLATEVGLSKTPKSVCNNNTTTLIICGA